MRTLMAAICAIALAGCATATPVPAARPLTQAYVATLGPTPVVVSQNNNGVEKAWFYTTTASAGAAYGLIGVLVTTTMDAIINAGPSARAQHAADEVAEQLSVDVLNASLVDHLNRQGAAAVAAPTPVDSNAPAADVSATVQSGADAAVVPATAPAETLAAPTGVSFTGASTVQTLSTPGPFDDAVQISVSYTLSEDASTLRIVATATYQSAATPYHSQYQTAGSPPRTELEGPAYRNTFTYYSRQLPVPTLTPELQERLVASIQDSARDGGGALPAEGTQQYNAMNREVAAARDDHLTKDEISIFLTREWLRDNGALLRDQVEQAHEFIARYLLLDINRTVVPNIAGQDELVETMPDERTVRRIGAGTAAGSYVSSAANVESFSTYGNTIGIARVNSDRINSIRQAARPRRRN